MSYHVRLSLSSDDAAIMQLVRDMHAESKYAHIPFDATEVSVILRLAQVSKDLRIFLVLNQDDVIMGFAAMHAAPYAFCIGRVISDIGVYVSPQFRNYRALLKLVRAVGQWGKDIGAHSIVFGVTAPEAPERVGKVYQRMGFGEWGRIYRKEL